MCSTFKLMLAAAILSRIDSGSISLQDFVHFSKGDLLPNSPVTELHLREGCLPVEALAKAVVEASDNLAANKLLTMLDGPGGYTRYLRGLGDPLTRLDRKELALNSNLPGDPRDTTTPVAMLSDMEVVLVGNALSLSARERLIDWMRNCRTGRARLRAGIPSGWRAGDKTGTGARGAVNDLAIFWPPGRQPILVTCYLTDSARDGDYLNSVHARIGKWVASTLV